MEQKVQLIDTGFYLDRSGAYNTGSIEIFHSLPQQYDFYLDYKMTDPSYSKDWRIHYPK